ncbi:YebC/PmpR family DNA-binding transcriptional regulator [Flavobacteriales bacterium]|jgi:YebC/PmpR family DNA-binding regulatory protein|nr:YebC/PmpR family DNA-binding transcriptional regulator [Flavobacteriales bacterium]MDB2362066.1 YebC/PmpR family DNA-binding transcriptional regulator [Flavobacteriales bacterium]
MGRAFEFRKARKMKRWSAMAKTFTRIGKDISMAVKEGGPNPETNSRLRAVIQNAKSANMPKDNVERAIKKASGSDSANYVEMSLEGYAPHGVAIFVECTTDNNNRTVANVRSYFNKCDGNLGTNGSLEFIFDRKAVFTFSASQIEMDLEELEMELIDAGLEELENDEGTLTVTSDFTDFSNMQKQLESMNIELESSELQRFPNNTKSLDLEDAKLVLKLIDKLEEDEDVQNVFHNMEMGEELMAQLDD